MLTVIVLSLLYIGSADMYTTSDFKKNVKKIIKERSREKAILADLKDFKKDQANFEKTLKKHTATFQEHYDKKALTEQVVDGFFEEIKLSYVDYYELRLVHRHELIENLQPKEWSRIVNTYQKAHDQTLKARARRFKLLDKEINDINKAIEKSIPDTVRVNKSKVFVEDIRLSFTEFYKASDKINLIDSEILKNKLSTDEEIMSVYNEWNEARSELYSQVIAKTTLLTREFSTEEWDKILDKLRKGL